MDSICFWNLEYHSKKQRKWKGKDFRLLSTRSVGNINAVQTPHKRMTPMLVSGKGEQNQNKSKKKKQKPKPSYFLKHWCGCTTNVKEASSLAKSHSSYEIRGRLFTFPSHSFFKCWIGKLLLILWSLRLFQQHEQSPVAVLRWSSHIYLYHRERRTSLPIGNLKYVSRQKEICTLKQRSNL